MKHKPDFVKFFFPAFYAAAFLFVVLNAWNIQTEVTRNSGPLYKNLRESPAYVKRGFDRTTIGIIPDAEWVRFPSASPARRIINSSLPDLPKRTYLSPFGKAGEEFTVAFVIEIDDKDLAFMNGGISVVPGFFFAGIGENWEIFLNGKSIYSEIHLDEHGQIKERRAWRDVYFPADISLFVLGTNVLALRIVGDPAYTMTGPYYSTAPIYMDDYQIIEKRQHNFLLVALGAICIFAGAYYLLLFFSIKNKKEIFNLYFGIFSILLCIYAVARNGMVNYLIPNTDITIRLEYFSLILMIPVFGLFIETLLRKKITKITWGYLAFCSLLALTQILFCNQYGQEIIYIWDITAMIYFSYVIAYDIIYFLLGDKHKKQERELNLDMPIGSILLGTIASYLCGIYDIFDVLFIRSSFNLFQYSIFVMHIGMIFALSQRFSGMYKRLEQSNVRLELAVQERTKELEEQTEIALHASQAKSGFLATMSHEIRTPLNAVIGLSEIELRSNLPESTKSNISQIYNSGSSLLGIINDILDISEIETGALELVPVEYETASFINDTVNLNKVRIGSKPITFVFEINGDFPQKLIGDELRVKQILNNILSNAIKYTQHGTITFSVSSSSVGVAQKNNALLHFIVRDTGIGIRKEDMNKLFSGYIQFNSKANRKSDGMGLGLEITKKLVEMMGGSITAESEYGRGSIFTVTIVQGLPDPASTIGEKTAEELRNFCYVASRKQDEFVPAWMPYGKVLVVDDVPVNIMIVEGLLESYGLRVDSATSGQKAIDMIQAENPRYDLVFMDHMMPGMDGIEATRIIRRWEEEQKHTRIPIVALTANAITGNIEKFLAAGFDGFISKPIDIVQLDEALNKYVRDKQNPVEEGTREQGLGTRDRNLKSSDASGLYPDSSNNTPHSLRTTPHSPFPIPGVDTEMGIKMTGGTMPLYRDVLALFCRDAEERLSLLEKYSEEDGLPGFVTQVHALKGASASIGAAEVPALAAQLETAGKDGDLMFIRENLHGFTERLAELINNISTALRKNAAAQTPSQETAYSPIPRPLLIGLAVALDAKKVRDIDRFLNELIHQSVDPKTKKIVDKISDDVLMAELSRAAEAVRSLYNRLPEKQKAATAQSNQEV